MKCSRSVSLTWINKLVASRDQLGIDRTENGMEGAEGTESHVRSHKYKRRDKSQLKERDSA